MLKLMAVFGWLHTVFDIKCAYLHATRDNCKRQIMKLTPRLTQQWVKKHPEDVKYVYKDCLFVLLVKALYGLKDSGRLWYNHLTAFLLRIGFVVCESDPCMYCKWISIDNFAYVLTHVDDLFLVGLGVAFTSFRGLLAATFPDFTEKSSDTFTYLGMTVIRNREAHSLTINQRSYIQSLLKTFDMTDCKPKATPAPADLLLGKEDNSGPCDKTLFLSILMSLMYMARISRPDILFTVCYLATKSSCATIKNLLDAKRVLRYLKGTINLALIYVGSAYGVCICADASHGLYPDGKGQHSTVIKIGNTVVVRSTNKMKCITLSSSESEIVGAADAATWVRWLYKLFKELRLPFTVPIRFEQDNLSTIQMIRNGPSFRRGKHMVIKGEFVRELEVEGLIEIVYAPSADMDADPYTKTYSEHQMVVYQERHFTQLE